MPRSQNLDDGIPVRSASKTKPFPLIPVVIAASCLMLLLLGVGVFAAVVVWKRSAGSDSGGSFSQNATNPRADAEGNEWTAEDLAIWLKKNGRIQGWENSSKNKDSMFIIAKLNETDVISIERCPGTISAELMARPTGEALRSHKLCWGRFNIIGLKDEDALITFKGISGIRTGFRDLQNKPITVPLEEIKAYVDKRERELAELTPNKRIRR